MGFGSLPIGFRASFRQAQESRDFYAVLSYDTPIAWYADGRWYMPGVFYSATTRRHESLVPAEIRHNAVNPFDRKDLS